MRTSKTMLFALLLFACGQTSATPATDGGADAEAPDAQAPDAQAPLGDFDVFLEHGGTPVEDSAELPVEFGCQGGSHVEIGVRAVGSGLERSVVSVAVLGARLPAETALELRSTTDGAELTPFIVPFGGFGAPDNVSDWTFPAAATVRVTVRARDGSEVTIERDVSLVMGPVCRSTCDYDDIAGAGRLTAIEVSGDATGCDYLHVATELTFEPDDPSVILNFPADDSFEFDWPAQCIEALTLDVGETIDLTRYEISLEGGGACAPVYYEGPNHPCDCL